MLWISLEDISPDLGCYGDKYAITPVIDKFASEGVRFTRAFTHAGVCAPSRSGLITGMYPTSIGSHHMRCKAFLPPGVTCFPAYLRKAGYYCTNNSKTDYNFAVPKDAWDANSNTADWRGRKSGQPFFAVINLASTHESQNRTRDGKSKPPRKELGPAELHDPDKAVLPPYYPDTQVVRRDWANYYDNITATERRIAEILKQLDDDGLADDTIVWFWGDHGRGLSRGKRWLYDSGLHVPLIVRVPEKWRGHAFGESATKFGPGSTYDDLVAFVDFAPTMLSLCGVEIPSHLQGQAFLGPKKADAPREFIYGHRDRMDERYDLIRAVRDRRFKYIRNFMPHMPYAQDIGYMNLMPMMQEWRRLNAEGKLVGPQRIFFEPTKPVEELYDCEADPHEINNLAADPAHRATLEKMRAELVRWMRETGDLGLVPEAMLDEMRHPRDGPKSNERWLAELKNSDLQEKLLAIKSLDGQGAVAIPAYEKALADGDAAVRYWAVVGLHHACETNEQREKFRSRFKDAAMDDEYPLVRVAAGHALCDWGDTATGLPALIAALEDDSAAIQLAASLSLDELGDVAKPALPTLRRLAKRGGEYPGRVTQHILEKFPAEK